MGTTCRYFSGVPPAFPEGLLGRERPSQGVPRECKLRNPAVPDPGGQKGGSLVCSILGYGRLICRSGSRGRPGLLRTRGGERSEPERVPNKDGGRTDGRLAVRGRTECGRHRPSLRPEWIHEHRGSHDKHRRREDDQAYRRNRHLESLAGRLRRARGESIPVLE